MADAPTTDLALFHSHLAPEEHAQLAAGTMPPERMRAVCERLRGELAAISTYIPPTIVREQLLHPQPGRVSGAYWHGSVLFADLSGFTMLSERLSALGKQGAEEVSAIINALFGALLDEIYRYQGSLLKFGGDALTAFFDAATLGPEHAELAAGAALAMQRRMKAFAALQTRNGVFTLRLRIGVHSGRVFAAQVGSVEHIELVITGHNINRVAEAQEIAEPGEVVISGATQTLLPKATTNARAGDFHLLHAMPPLPPIPPTPRAHWAMGVGDVRELRGLAARIDALRPYLPRHLPRRFLRSAEDGTETGEFRPVTMLFANFYPFSDILDALHDDTDSATHILNTYYNRAQDVIHRYGGIVNKVDMYTHGDKLIGFFGAPIAHEDDPERATRAALELREMLDTVNAEVTTIFQNRRTAEPQNRSNSDLLAHLLTPSPLHPVTLSQKIGINTGVVFAGPVGSARRHEYTVMGRDINLAARLMAAAAEGAIVLSPSTRRAVEHIVDVRELAPVRLKGIAEPVPIVEAVRSLEVSRVLRGVAQAELVGRDDELTQMVATGAVALRGAGRVVALVGEAGAGKTRLIESTLQQLILQTGARDGPPAFFPYHVECQSYAQNAPYAAISELLRQMFNIVPQMPAVPIQRRVEELAPDLVRFTPLLRDIVGLPLEDTPLTAALTPQQRHDRMEELVEALLLGEAREQPLVVIVDDLHWADASSLALLQRLARRIADAPILLLLGYRTDPPLDEPWRELPHATWLHVHELPPDCSVALLESLLDGSPPEALTAVIERAQGNPFFIEEVVRGLVESGALVRDASGWQLTRVLDEAAVPNSIEGVINARLDRLDERSREVVQNAAVIGRRFPLPVLFGIIARRDDLPDRLARLAAADLIHPDDLDNNTGENASPLQTYLFRHTLTRDVAYETILYARRRDLHARVAHQIEQVYAGRLDDQLALLARHSLLAEDWPRAFDYHLQAGRQAQARYANREAIALLERALEITARGQESGVRSQGSDFQHPIPDTQYLTEVHERLGLIRALLGEYDVAMRHYEAAMMMLRERDDAPLDDVVRLHHHIARVHEKRAEFDTAFGWVQRGLALAGNEENTEVVRCLLLGAGLHQRQGRYQQAIEWGERALRLAEQLGSVREQGQAYKLLGNTHLNLGNTNKALLLLRLSLEMYNQLYDLDGLSYAYNDLANTYYELGLLSKAQEYYERGVQIKHDIGDIYGKGIILCNLGEVLRTQGKLEEAVKSYSFGLAIYEQIRSPYMTGVLHMNLGNIYLLQGDIGSAETHLNHSIELFSQSGAEDFLPELERYMAELHLCRGHIDQARQHCETSLLIAARLKAGIEEGASRRTLAQILVQSGNLRGAWQELEHSLSILREAASPHEIARTLLAMAGLAPSLNRHAEGQAALDEALPILRSVGAQRDIEEALKIAVQQGYNVVAEQASGEKG